ncbi:GntR family transcriptional regulator [Mesorhizobium sp. INR15]|uniref:GntR family transcriptional regulator n=1 Tax=Mesorhizobium sp. INR15 TaxID=2654248 RepID=UPI001896607E|nr:GntR family transcriptional regulator [Mesorhizobium sp. INR15]QPC90377.1 FCD domain-containing protein [Mesorhizobium sp. INR15]
MREPLADQHSASTVQQVAAAIAAAVRGGHLAPGQRLTEAEFVRRFSVSRSSVREAFQRLAADGLLTFEPHRGVVVRQLSRKEVDNLFEVRGALEALAVGLGAPKFHADPQRLLALQNEMDRAVEANDMSGFSDLNRRFHAMFAETADNALLDETLGRLSNSIYWLQFRLLINRQQVFQSNAQHRLVVEAIIAGDAQAAQAAMREHVDTSRRLIQQLPDDHFASA